MNAPNQSAAAVPSGPSVGFYAHRPKADFLERGYAAAPPPIREALEQEIRFLRAVVPPAKQALELGCGHGRLLEALRDCAERWLGLDLVEDFLHQAREREALRGRAAFLAASMVGLPFASSSFDVVVCGQSTLGLLGDKRQAVMHEVARVLRPGGRFFATVYSEFSIVPRVRWYVEMHRLGLMAALDWERSTPRLLVTEDEHASECFRPGDLAPLFRRAGFEAHVERLGEIYWAVEARKIGS